MTDNRIIQLLDVTHPSGLGRGGFEYKLNHVCGLIYDDAEDMILNDCSCKYVNPLGPFKKWVTLHAYIETRNDCYSLSFKDEFWPALTESDAIYKYLRPFLHVLRQFSNNAITESDIWKMDHRFSSHIYKMDPERSPYFGGWIEQIKKYNPGVY